MTSADGDIANPASGEVGYELGGIEAGAALGTPDRGQRSEIVQADATRLQSAAEGRHHGEIEVAACKGDVVGDVDLMDKALIDVLHHPASRVVRTAQIDRPQPRQICHRDVARRSMADNAQPPRLGHVIGDDAAQVCGRRDDRSAKVEGEGIEPQLVEPRLHLAGSLELAYRQGRRRNGPGGRCRRGRRPP